MARRLGEVRRSQLITTYGVGAIVAVEDESFMIAGLDNWGPAEDLQIHEPRLERLLNVRHFTLPPASDDDRANDVPVVRFPAWYFCPVCEELNEHRRLSRFDRAQCNACGSSLVPSRFIMACDVGHIDDFPYFQWLHRGDRGEGNHRLSITTLGVTASLRDIVISCSCGVPARSLDGAFARDALRGIRRCTGARPWLGGDAEECTLTPRTLQRGASNVWFPVVASALSIPPWSEAAFKALNRHWDALRHIDDETILAGVIRGMRLDQSGDFSVEDLLLAIAQRREAEAGGPDQAATPLKQQEYEALLRGREERSSRQDFVCTAVDGVGDEIARFFDRVMVARRLREVRALSSFTRLTPLDLADDDARRAPLAASDTGWLPAIEVIGEGVFLRLDEEMLRTWEMQEPVISRGRWLRSAVENRPDAGHFDAAERTSPRYLAVHTLAHILIDQWALDCGYPAASLRERLYVSEDHAALLIYTATSDSAGSLGGLTSQARPTQLQTTLREAILRAAWCSGDPLCLESEPGGADAANLAACHACVLLPETSCEERNTYLDRAMLIGVPGHVPGLFASWVR